MHEAGRPPGPAPRAAAGTAPPPRLLTKNQKKKRRQRLGRLAQRLAAHDSTDTPLLVCDVRTPTGALAPLAAAKPVHLPTPCAVGAATVATGDGSAASAATATAWTAAGAAGAPVVGLPAATAAGDASRDRAPPPPAPPPSDREQGGRAPDDAGRGDGAGDDGRGRNGEKTSPSGPSPPSHPCRADLSPAAAAISAALAGRAGASPASAAALAAAARASPAPPAPLRAPPAPVGNYARYYGYRLAAGATSAAGPGALAVLGRGAADARVAALRSFAHLFAGAPLLDVGCNEGVVTRALVAACRPSAAVGVDVDPRLVSRAAAALRRHRAAVAAHAALLRSGAAPPPGPGEPGGASARGRLAAARGARAALARTRFLVRDAAAAAAAAPPPLAACGGVVCLSVTKWVHLAGGDAALDALFAALAGAAAVGGHVVLEPQLWPSYARAAKKAGVKAASVPLTSLALRPEGFVDHLAHRHGLTYVRRLDVGGGECAAGFDRPVLLFRRDK